MSKFFLSGEDGVLKVVSMGTGSKCLGESKLNKDGESVCYQAAPVKLFYYSQSLQIPLRLRLELECFLFP